MSQPSNDNTVTSVIFKLICTYTRVVVIAAVCLVVIACLSNCGNVVAQPISNLSSTIPSTQNSNTNMNNTRTLLVTGTADTKVQADEVILTLGVQTINKTAVAALATNSAIMNNVISILKAGGVKQNETSTSSFNISPNYNYSRYSGGVGKITGFTASNSLQIKSSNINNVPKWIDSAIAGGATNVNNVAFTLSDKKIEETKNLLIKEAINSARTKADLAASTLGLKVVGAKSATLNESETPPQPPLLSGQSSRAAIVNPTTPVISGQEQVFTTVSIVFLIG